MSAFASVISPYSYSAAIELGNHRWSKRILPVGDLEYQGRQLHFTPAYIRGLAQAFHNRAYDQVSFQLADAQNSHTNDPERHRGTIVDMKAQPDGLWITLEPTERGEEILRQNPLLGVSARIVEQFQRGDGAFFPAAIQHVLGTLDPRIPGLGAWEPVSLSNGGDSSITIDLSNLSFAGEPAYAPATFDGLTDAELGDLLDAMDEVGVFDGYDGTEVQMHDDAGYTAAAGQFDQAFAARAAADAAREQMRAELDMLDTVRPAVRSEDKMARALQRATHGLYDTSGTALGFAAEQRAIELTVATGAGICGNPDEWGRCASRWHSTDCLHQVGVDWTALGQHREQYATSLANFADGIELAAPTTYGDPDDDEPAHQIPAGTLEFASALADSWGLHGDHWTGPPASDPLRAPAMPVTAYEAMAAEVSYDNPASQPYAGYPGIAEIRQRMGI